MNKDRVSSVSTDCQTSATEDIRQQTKLSIGKSDKNNDINNAETVTSECSSARATSATVPTTEQSGSGQQMTFANLSKVFCFLSKVMFVR